MDAFTEIMILAGTVLGALLGLGFVFSRLYNRATKERAFVRTGFGGQKVVMNGGALVLPVLHEIIHVNMNTLRLEVRRSQGESLITKDRLRVDVVAAFYVRVKPTEESIANAAQTLGARTLDPEALRELVEDKFVDSLRSVAAEMTMNGLQDERPAFVQKVQNAVTEDLLKNGLELESVSLTSLDQTSKDFFNPNNAFDAEGLTKLTQEIEGRRRERNAIEQDTEVAVREKNLAADRQKMEIDKQQEFVSLEQQQEIAKRRAEQAADVAQQGAEKEREAEQAKILAKQQVDQARIEAERQVQEREVEKVRAVQSAQIAAERAVEAEKIEKDKLLQEKLVEQQKAVEVAGIERLKATQLADQTRAIDVAVKSKDQSEAEAQANQARAESVRTEEQVVTVREVAKAEREKSVVLVEAQREAEQQAINITVAAEAERDAALSKAVAVKTLAEAEAEAEKIRAVAQQATNTVRAEGERLLNEARNLLAPDQIALQVRLALLGALPAIIRESVKPMEQIDGIKIIQVGGLNGSASAVNGEAPANGSLGDQMVNAALRYRSQAPLLDSLLAEVGLKGGELNGLTQALGTPPNGGTA